MLAAAAALLATGRAVYDLQARAAGHPPLPGGWSDILYVAGTVLLIGVLVVIFKRRAPDGRGLGDMLAIGIGTAVALWVYFGHRLLGLAWLPPLGRWTQVVFELLNIAMFAVLLRTTVVAGRRTPALTLLLVGALAYFVENVAWDWLTVANVTVGRWPLCGCDLLVGFGLMASLHPSMRDIASPTGVVTSPRVELRAAALLVAPVTFALAALARGPVGMTDAIVIIGGSTVLWALVLRDMSGLVRRGRALSSQLAERNERLLELDRLKDQFVAEVSHDLRNPLASMGGALFLLRRRGELTDEARELLRDIEGCSKRMDREIGQLLSMTRIVVDGVNPRRAPVDLNALLRECVRTFRATAEQRGVTLSLELGDELSLDGDAGLLTHAIDNLVANAIKFTPDGGAVHIGAAKRGTHAILEVADTGIGVAEQDHELVFERFYRGSTAVERNIPGTGLGLFLVRSIVAAHDGRVELESSPGEGSRFRLELPLAGAMVEAEHPHVAGVANPPKSPLSDVGAGTAVSPPMGLGPGR